MGSFSIGRWLRNITCQHRSTMTNTGAFSTPHPHVVSRTVCLDCGKSVSPASPVPDNVIHEMLMRAKAEAEQRKS